MTRDEFVDKSGFDEETSGLIFWSVKEPTLGPHSETNFMTHSDATAYIKAAGNPEGWEIKVLHIHTEIHWLKGKKHAEAA